MAPALSVPAVVVALLLTACAGEPAARDGMSVRDSAGIRIVETSPVPAWPPEAGWYVQPIPWTGADAEVGFVSDAKLGPDGRLYAMDAQGLEVRVFGADGQVVGRVGGPGPGPGELEDVVRSILVLSGEAGPELWVPENSGHVVERFDLDGEWLGSLRREGSKELLDAWRIGADGALYARAREYLERDDGSWGRRDLLVRVGAEMPEPGASQTGVLALDSVVAFDFRMDDLTKEPGAGLPPVVNAPVWTVLADGTVAWADLRTPEVRLRGPDGSETRLRRDSWRPRRPSDGEEQALQLLALESLRMKGAPVGPDSDIPFEPMTWLPVVTDLRAGPAGTLWVQTLGSVRDAHPANLNTSDEPFGWGGSVWEVFQVDGRFLGTVDLPSRFRVTEIRDDRIVGVRYDRNFVDGPMVLEILQGEEVP